MIRIILESHNNIFIYFLNNLDENLRLRGHQVHRRAEVLIHRHVVSAQKKLTVSESIGNQAEVEAEPVELVAAVEAEVIKKIPRAGGDANMRNKNNNFCTL